MPWWGPTIASPEVRLVQSNDGHWLAAWEDDGKPHSENLGDVAKIPLPEAQKLCGLAQTRLATSRPPAQESLDAVAGFWRGNGGEVPWELWWRPMLFWTGTCLAFEAMLMGLLLMFRRRWIEHERLPMVWSQPALHIIGPEDFHRPPRRRGVGRGGGRGGGAEPRRFRHCPGRAGSAGGTARRR